MKNAHRLAIVFRVCCFAALLHLVSPRLALGADGSDWPQFLGPTRDGLYPGDDLAAGWPAEGPSVLWKMRIGAGWSAPVVAEGKLLIFQRNGDKETLDALEPATGKAIWSTGDPTTYQDDFGFDEGPRATPTVVGGRIFTYGAQGLLNCRELKSGNKIWSVDTKEAFGQDKGFFGMVCSPLVEGDSVILNIGAKDAGIVAFDVRTGKTVWKATSDAASYSSPVAATIDGKRYVLVLTRSELVALEPVHGKMIFKFPFRSPMEASVNAATPLVIGDCIFLSASYQTGAALLQLKESGPHKVWAGDNILSNHYSTSVYRDGFLYGFDGRQEMGQHLKCVELQTGKVRWTRQDPGAGTIILAGDRLLILSESGELIEAAATPQAYQVLGHMQVVGFGTRSHAALSHGLYFARGKSELVCVQLGAHK